MITIAWSAGRRRGCTYHGVDSASSGLCEHEGRTLLLVEVRLDGRASAVDVCRAIESRAVAHAHARQALDVPDLPARVEVTLSPRRVRNPR